MIIKMVQTPTASAHHDRFSVAEGWRGRIAVLSVRDAVDMLTAPQLSEAICAALAKAPDAVIVDLTDVDFLASVGMSVLVEAQEQASAKSVQFGVVADGAATSRPIKLLGIDTVLALYPTLDEALGDSR